MSTEHDPLDPVFAWRLKAALDRVTPPHSRPRYESKSMGGLRPWRVAPFLLAAAMVVLLALTATATTGSPNPVVWTRDAASTIESVGHAPEVTPAQPSPEQAPASPRKAPAPAAAATHNSGHEAPPKPKPSDHPEDSPRPESTNSPQQRDDRSGSSPNTNPNTNPGSHTQPHTHGQDN
jgi:hypothetical protein